MPEKLTKCEAIVRHDKTGRPVACGRYAGHYRIFPIRADAPNLSPAALIAWYVGRGGMSCEANLCDRHKAAALRQGKAVIAA